MNSKQVDKLKQRWQTGDTDDKLIAKRRPQDFYPTPPHLVQKAIDLIPQRIQPRRILDPGAGTGVWGEAARSRWPDAAIDGIDSRDYAEIVARANGKSARARTSRGGSSNGSAARNKAYTNWWTGDYLTTQIQGGYDLILGTPPYSQAEKFVRQSIKLLKPDGQLLFLLRLAFLEGRTRANGLYALYPPYKVYVLAERPSFAPAGDASRLSPLNEVKGKGEGVGASAAAEGSGARASAGEETAIRTDTSAYMLAHWSHPGFPHETVLDWLSWK